MHNKLPDIVDSSQQFQWYKNKNKDITFDYFQDYKHILNICIINPINYHDGPKWETQHQFTNYANLDYNGIMPLIKKYFSPSVEINNIINNIEAKHNLIYENICVLFYRGNDKNRETLKCSYDEYFFYANEIIAKNPKIIFLIQSDETEFIEFMSNKFPNNSFF